MRRLGVLLSLGVMACPAPQPTPQPEEDAGVEPYDGPTSTRIPPAVDPDDHDFDAGQTLIDAGTIVVETRCCQTRFSISSAEPADAVGVLEGELPVLKAGRALTREDGGWVATACHPIGAAGHYWYRFTWDAGIVDAGTELLDDGGIETLEVATTETIVRASEREPSVTNSEGARNFFRSVSSCDGLDGGVPW